ncbi:VWA domain-containing protein [Marinomonas sp. 15G1-11]|uniref:VWA domain-containing protein n=1 Tax=Marinomonas phaeophyticola TaxID=3004091 RepID=A0ABT4JWS0_9GAMM|nr:VWA domain-containing protein [Marinomonas sp. 15G1-11]MCZ2722815.1 VWA domain-containing protein [Marinomonas sp. 15G1-11]
MLEFVWPWFFLLLPLPLLMRFITPTTPKSEIIWWPTASLISKQSTSQSSGRVIKNPTLILFLCAWLVLVTAIARPVWVGDPIEITPSGRDLFIAVDLSGSMQVTDMQVNKETVDRLSAAKHVLNDFISTRKGDRIGIIVFGTKAYLQAPLSYDLEALNKLINENQIGFAGEQTAIGDAIGLGIKQLENKDSDKKVLILMTDGANTAGRVQPAQAASFAASQNVKIHTIGIGADEMVVQGFFGPKVINPSSDLDEPLLQDIASSTGGHYFRARSTSELSHIYHLIDQLEPTPSEDLWQRPKTTLLHWLGLLGLILIGFGFILQKTFLSKGSK